MSSSHIKSIDLQEVLKLYQDNSDLKPQFNDSIDDSVKKLAKECLEIFKRMPSEPTISRAGVQQAIREIIESEFKQFLKEDKAELNDRIKDGFPKEITLEEYACRIHRFSLDHPFVAFSTVKSSLEEINTDRKRDGLKPKSYEDVLEAYYFPMQISKSAKFFFGQSFAILTLMEKIDSAEGGSYEELPQSYDYIDFPVDVSLFNLHLNEKELNYWNKLYPIIRDIHIKRNKSDIVDLYENQYDNLSAIVANLLYNDQFKGTNEEIAALVLDLIRDPNKIIREIQDTERVANAELLETRKLIAEHFYSQLMGEEWKPQEVPTKTKGKKAKKGKAHPPQKTESGGKSLPQLQLVSSPKQEEGSQLHKEIASLFTFEEAEKLTVLSRISRWATKDLEEIQAFSDWDGSKEVYRYKGLDINALRFQRACHWLPGLAKLALNKTLKEMYTFPTERGYGLLASLHQDGKMHPGVVYLGIEDKRLFHCYFTPYKQNARTIQEYFQEPTGEGSTKPQECALESTAQYKVKVGGDCSLTFIYPGEDYSLSVKPLT